MCRPWPLLLAVAVGCTDDSAAPPLETEEDSGAGTHESTTSARDASAEPLQDARALPASSGDSGAGSEPEPDASPRVDDAGQLPISVDAGALPTGDSAPGDSGQALDASFSPSNGDAAPYVDAAAECEVPTVLLLVQRSGAMFSSNLSSGSSPTPYHGFEDRWEAVRAAIQALDVHAPHLRLGVMTYTGAPDGTCPATQQTEAIQGDIEALMQLLPPSAEAIEDANQPGQNVITEGLEAAYQWLATVADEGPKYLFVIGTGTGADLCFLELTNKGEWCGLDPAIATVQNARLNGVETHVFGVDNESESAAHFLRGLAHAGRGLDVAPNPLGEDDLPRDLHCIEQESTIARGLEPGDDFPENWRAYAAATYGPDGMEYGDEIRWSLIDTRSSTDSSGLVEEVTVNRLVYEASVLASCSIAE